MDHPDPAQTALTVNILSVSDVVPAACVLDGERRIENTSDVRPRKADVRQIAVAHHRQPLHNHAAMAPLGQSSQQAANPGTKPLLRGPLESWRLLI